MSNSENQSPSTPVVEVVLDSIADWVSKYRDKISLYTQFERCGRDEVMRVAKELGVTRNELLELARKGPGSADLLHKMLIALGVDPKPDPRIMNDLERLCITCSQKKRCEHELANGTAGAHFREFCPNAFTLDALLDPPIS